MTRATVRSGILALALLAAGCNATGATQRPVQATLAPPTQAPTQGPLLTTPAALRGPWTADIAGTTASSGHWTLLLTESNLSLQNPVGGDPFTLDPVSFTET